MFSGTGCEDAKKAEQRLREFPEEEDQLTQLGEPRSEQMVMETAGRRNWTLGLLDERVLDKLEQARAQSRFFGAQILGAA